jgi:hypothetical protein
MADRWDADTETWFLDVGRCPYCHKTLYINPDPDIKYTGYTSVREPDNHAEQYSSKEGWER